jgi:hypothetical protein
VGYRPKRNAAMLLAMGHIVGETAHKRVKEREGN